MVWGLYPKEGPFLSLTSVTMVGLEASLLNINIPVDEVNIWSSEQFKLIDEFLWLFAEGKIFI